jgi:DNA-binding transcriptional MerR regulator
MTRKKQIETETEDFGTPPGELLTFGTGDVAKILAVPIWRIQSYIDSPKYRLSPSGRLGSGSGSRRVFSTEDVYRIGIADYLVRVGFVYKFVAKIVQMLDEEDLFGSFNSEGQEIHLPYVIAGGENALIVRPINPEKPLSEVLKRVKSTSFYFLDLPAITTQIQKQITTVQQNSQKGR